MVCHRDTLPKYKITNYYGIRIVEREAAGAGRQTHGPRASESLRVDPSRSESLRADPSRSESLRRDDPPRPADRSPRAPRRLIM